ncbi:hypothetical protein [Prevotella denticola]|uniref:hypothetical protein n=1 Tax=Prevotella denticola TaxID=28129 RepID=UPI0028EC33A0|nr:hypothetical protein [Prevotella denticola]
MDQWNRYRRVESSQHPTCPGAYRAWYNRFWGEERGKFLHVSYNSYAHRMAIYAISTEQRTLELDTLADENEWKDKLPTGFYSEEPWEEGKEYE